MTLRDLYPAGCEERGCGRTDWEGGGVREWSDVVDLEQVRDQVPRIVAVERGGGEMCVLGWGRDTYDSRRKAIREIRSRRQMGHLPVSFRW